MHTQDDTALPTSVFQDLIAGIHPDRILTQPTANGEAIRVAVVDSGVDTEVLQQKHPQMKVVAGGIFRPNEPQPFPFLGKQSSPHGTTVADILLRIAPAISLYSADVFGNTGTTDIDTLLHALEYILEKWPCQIINLSLGVSEARLIQPAKRQQFARLIERAYYQGISVFAAAHNEHPLVKSYPAVFGTALISVDKGLFPTPLQFGYNVGDTIEFRAHGRGYLGPFSREPTTSWATPHLAGIAARILSMKPDLKPFELKTILYWLCQHWNNRCTQE
ncbi:MAG: S8 family serine peptidase [Zavarzinella sp.]